MCPSSVSVCIFLRQFGEHGGDLDAVMDGSGIGIFYVQMGGGVFMLALGLFRIQKFLRSNRYIESCGICMEY